MTHDLGCLGKAAHDPGHSQVALNVCGENHLNDKV